MLDYLVAAHIAIALLTTFVIFRLGYAERSQAFWQALIAWLVPFIGAALILAFQSIVHRNMTTKSKPDSSSHYHDEGLAGDLYHGVDADD